MSYTQQVLDKTYVLYVLYYKRRLSVIRVISEINGAVLISCDSFLSLYDRYEQYTVHYLKNYYCRIVKNDVLPFDQYVYIELSSSTINACL